MTARKLPLAALAVALAAPAAAQESPLTRIPAAAPVVVQLRGHERTVERLGATARAAVPDLGPIVAMQVEGYLTSLLGGRELKGLPKDAPIFIVLPELPDAEQDRFPGALVFPAENYVRFRDGFLTEEERKTVKADAAAGYEVATVNEREAYFLDRTGCVVVAFTKSAAALFKDKKPQPSLADKLAGPTAEKLLGADVSAYVDVAALRKKYDDQIKQLKTLLDQALQQGAGVGGVDKESMERAKMVFDGMSRLLDDGDAAVAGVDFRPEGLHVALSI